MIMMVNDGASVKVNIINKVNVIDNISAVKIRYGRWQASSSLFPTIIRRLRSSTAIYSILCSSPVNKCYKQTTDDDGIEAQNKHMFEFEARINSFPKSLKIGGRVFSRLVLVYV
jgi:hypothetical protein